MKKAILILLMVLFFFGNLYADQYDFRKTKWGMSKSQVKTSEKAKFENQNNDTMLYRSKLAGMKAIIMYSFISNKLHSGMYIFEERHMNKNDYITDFNKLTALLTKKYGSPIEDRKIWKKNLYKNNPQDYGMALSVGHLLCRAKWKTKTTEIIHGLNGDNFKINHLLSYRSKKLSKDSEKADEKKTLDDL